MTLLYFKFVRLTIMFSTLFLCQTELFCQQMDVHSLSEKQLGSVADTIKPNEKNLNLLHQLFLRSVQINNSSIQFELTHKLGIYHFRKTQKDSCQYYYNISENLYETNGLKEKKIEDFYVNKGILLVDLGFISEAIQYFNKGLELFLNDENYVKANECKLNLGNCYNELKEFEKSVAIIKEVLKDSIHTNKRTKAGAYNAISLAYNELGEYDEAIKWVGKGIELFDKKNNPHIISTFLSNLGLFHSGKGNHEKALEYSLEALALSESNGYHRLNKIRYGNVGAYYLDIKNYQKAREYLLKAIQDNPRFESLKEVYTSFISLYEQLGETENLKKTYEAYLHLLDSIIVARDQGHIRVVDKQRQLIEQEYKNRELIVTNQWVEEKNYKQQLIIIGLTIILAISLLCIYLVYRFKKNQKVITALKSKEKQLLEGQIKLRDNELDASAIALYKRIEAVNKIKEELSLVDNNPAQLTRVNETIKKILTESASDLSIITDRVESRYPTITAELKNKHPELTETEIKYCLLTKLNLSIKETAQMLNVTPSTVKVTRSRLKRKMAAPQDISFKNYLDKICHSITDNSEAEA